MNWKKEAEALLEKMSQAEKGYEVKVCFGLNKCPNALTSSSTLLTTIEEILENEKLTEFLKSKVKGPLRAHHKFRVYLSECPNACSQIHIADFAMHGVVRVEVHPKECSFCGSCLEVCEEEAIELLDFGPNIQEEKCVGCGACVKICPEGALVSHEVYYKIYLGGKLGRHPRLASFYSLANEEEALSILKKVLTLYKAKNEKGERLGTIIEKLGWENFKKLLQE